MSVEFQQLKDNFDKHWGGFRKWIALHPLSTFWGTLIAASTVGYWIGRAL